MRQTTLMSLSIGVLTNQDGPFYDIRELSEAAEEARRSAILPPSESSRRSIIQYGRGR
jgi:hypothetical protein